MIQNHKLKLKQLKQLKRFKKIRKYFLKYFVILKNCCTFALSNERDEKLLPHEAVKILTRGRKNYHESPLHLPLWGSETRKRKIFTKTPSRHLWGSDEC